MERKYTVPSLFLVVGILGLFFSLSPLGSSLFHISFLIAFFGGIISLLSPCTAAVLPAFFAYAFKEKEGILGKSIIFFIGLSIPLIILGFSASLVGQLFTAYRPEFVTGAGIIIILFGIMSLWGKGFSLPGVKQLAGSRPGKKGVFAFGALFGTGFVPCAGPILGSILTLAAASQSAVLGILLLETYAIGIMVPVFILSYVMDKRGFGESIQKTFTIAGRKIYWTNLLSGFLFISLGLVFIVFGGSSFLTTAFDNVGLLTVFYTLNGTGQSFLAGVPDWILFGFIALSGAIAFLFAWRRRVEH